MDARPALPVAAAGVGSDAKIRRSHKRPKASVVSAQAGGPGVAPGVMPALEAPPLKPIQWLAHEVEHKRTNLLVSSPAGYGKTTVLKKVIIPALLRGSGSKAEFRKRVWVTAMTSAAARQVGKHARTLHSMAGVGKFAGTAETLLENIRSKPAVLARWKAVDTIVLEECSLCSAVNMEKLNAVAQQLRGSAQFMGGIRVILMGDFLQLPPCSDLKASEGPSVYQYQRVANKYMFKARCWDQADFLCVRLSHCWRHAQCPRIAQMLERLRVAVEWDDTMFEALGPAMHSAQPLANVDDYGE